MGSLPARFPLSSPLPSRGSNIKIVRRQIETELDESIKAGFSTPPEPEQPGLSPKEVIQLQLSEERARLVNTQTTDVFNPIAYGQLKQVATDMVNSKAMPRSIENAMQALMLMQAGMEMGLKPIQSIMSLYIVNGSINIWGKAVIARLTNAGYRVKYEDKDGGCTATVSKVVWRDGNPEEEAYTETVTYAEAELSGYTKSAGGTLKPGWLPGMNRRLKLRYQALSLILKTYLPHLLGSTAGIVEVNEDYEPDKYEITLAGKSLPKPSRQVDAPNPPAQGIADKIMSDIKNETN